MDDLQPVETGFVAVAITVVLFLLLAGCKQSPTLATLERDEWVCTASHPVSTTTYVKTGNVLMPITTTRKVCDEYKRRP